MEHCNNCGLELYEEDEIEEGMCHNCFDNLDGEDDAVKGE